MFISFFFLYISAVGVDVANHVDYRQSRDTNAVLSSAYRPLTIELPAATPKHAMSSSRNPVFTNTRLVAMPLTISSRAQLVQPAV